jgi:oligopeptidase B
MPHSLKKAGIFAALTWSLFQCTPMNDTQLKEPIAKELPYKMVAHDHERIDPYYWLRDRENPEVIDYLNAENAYREAVMAGTKDLQNTLFKEITGRIKKDDASVPYFKNGYWYYVRFEGDKEYPIHCRKRGTLEATEEVILDVNELAQGHSYYAAAGLSVSPDNQWLAFGEDTVSRRIYTLRFKNLTTGEFSELTIPGTGGGAVWANNSQTFFYSRKNLETLRQEWIMRADLNGSAPVQVFWEEDETFDAFVYKTKSMKYIMIGTSTTLADEYHYLDADFPLGAFQVIQPRERDLEYSVGHFEDHWYIRTNKDGARNFKLMKTPLSATGKSNWTDVVAHRDSVYLEGFEILKDYLVLEERSNGLNNIKIARWDGKETYQIPFAEETYMAYLGTNPEFDTQVLRFGYTSMTTPSSVIDLNLQTKVQTVLKEQEVVGGYDKSAYASERVWATAPDGTKVPISLVYRKDQRKETGNPLLLYGYGSYGATIDPGFSSTRLSLLDRGFIYAIAHVRGGQYLGRAWYEDGKLLKKMNTFTDFIACGEFLVQEGYTQTDKMFAMGGSAGGLLMGAVVNLRPDLWKGVVAQVPFVDVVTTMLDETIPLTTFEYDEWGNPNQLEYYNYMLSYSPYDQVKAQAYPAMLVTTGLHDSQVQYWEPAKWVAKLRAMRTDKSVPLLMYCNMETGHGGASGRFEAYRETAMEYAFMLDLLGINQ